MGPHMDPVTPSDVAFLAGVLLGLIVGVASGIFFAVEVVDYIRRRRR